MANFDSQNYDTNNSKIKSQDYETVDIFHNCDFFL